MLSLENRKLISRSRRILIPVKAATISNLPAILDEIAPYLHRSCSLQLLGLCPPFLSGGDGELAYAYSLHRDLILTTARDALTRLVNENSWSNEKAMIAACEGGSSQIVSASRDYCADLILLASPKWTTLARWKVAYLRKSSDCEVLLLSQPQRPEGGWPISLAQIRMMTAGANLSPVT